MAAPSILDANGEALDSNGRGPWWARLSALAAVTLIAVFLVYKMAEQGSTQAAAILANTEALKSTLSEHQRHTEELHRNIEDYMRVQNLLTRQLCVNAAKTADDRAACFRP